LSPEAEARSLRRPTDISFEASVRGGGAFKLLGEVLGVTDNQPHPVAPPFDEVLGRVPEVTRTAIVHEFPQAAPAIGNLACDIDAAT
jgi:hypothetical protein